MSPYSYRLPFRHLRANSLNRSRGEAKNAVVKIAVAGLVGFGGAVAFAGPAAADPPPEFPVDPVAPVDPPGAGSTVPLMGPLGSQGINFLAQNGQPAVGPLGVPSLGAVDGDLVQLLGQNPVPAPPGGRPGAVPVMNAFNNQYLLPQNEVPSAPGTGTEVGVAPGDENKDLGRIAYLRQIHALHVNGNLKGSLLGQLPQQQLGEPLPALPVVPPAG